VRPVNLIPQDQRRGERAAMRSGPVAYILVGALVIALAGVTMLVITENQIASRKTQVTQLRRENAVARVRASRLAAFTQFQKVHDARIATVTSLADSRFAWERVMRELALVLPHDVWLTNLTATDNPQVTPGGGSSIPLRASVPGPALGLVGCARSQTAVAGFVQALKEIEGVTRVGVQYSALGGETGSGSVSSGSAAPAEGSSAASPCEKPSYAGFQIVAAFDAAPVPSTASSATATTTSSTSSTESTTSSSSGATSSSGTPTSSATPSSGSGSTSSTTPATSSGSTSSTTPSTSTTSSGSGE
jgi:Tfp pilus assembly protein PilN